MALNSTLFDRTLCSNHGYYDAVIVCVCDNGWTGKTLATSESSSYRLTYLVLSLN